MALTKLSSAEFQTGAITTDKFSGDVALSVRIANVSIANSTYTVLDDTAVNVGGGYIVVTGAGFQSGAQVVINETPATSTTFVSSTELRAQIGAKSAATYDVYVINPDGGNAISVNGITYSGLPTWVTGSTLDAQNVDVAFNVSFSATGATSYANTTTLPAGTVLLSNGYFYGTVTGIGSETTYNFTISAIDNENQNSDREFSLTVAVGNPPISVEYLVVAGGGGGGAIIGGNMGDVGGGGGGGGVLTGNSSITAAQTYVITIGAGSVSTDNSLPENGSNSSFDSVIAIGGGKGGTVAETGYLGGSGGGAGMINPSTLTTRVGGSGTPGQGFSGGRAQTTPNRTGGGGGGGGAGGNSSPSKPGDGGIGFLAFDGNRYSGGGGGAGGQGPSNRGIGGAGGGGPGAYNLGSPSFAWSTSPSDGRNATVNTGGGGGGGATITTGVNNYGGNGGSGIVIIRYADTYGDASSTTGSPTYTNTGGYKTYKFTGSGSITW